jgi:REP element-mobilizing transposase RayT
LTLTAPTGSPPNHNTKARRINERRGAGIEEKTAQCYGLNQKTNTPLLRAGFCTDGFGFPSHGGLMLDDDGFEIYEENEFPLAYLITIRTFGTWLHGDERLSVDRHGMNVYGTTAIAPNPKLNTLMKSELKQPPMIFNDQQRNVVEVAIRELCEQRKYDLKAINVRTNHAHAVISVQASPERIADACKAFATKKLREEKLVDPEAKIWSRGRSRRYLWKPRHVELAIEYVLHGQGEVPFEIGDE